MAENSKATPGGATAREQELIMLALSCLKVDVAVSHTQGFSLATVYLLTPCFPQIDYEAFAKAGNFKNVNSARSSFAVVKKKFFKMVGQSDDDGAASTTTTPKTPVTPKKRVRKPKAEKTAEAAANGETAVKDEDEIASPVKKRKTTAKVTSKPDSECVSYPFEFRLSTNFPY
jgi:hypothetical protein